MVAAAMAERTPLAAAKSVSQASQQRWCMPTIGVNTKTWDRRVQIKAVNPRIKVGCTPRRLLVVERMKFRRIGYRFVSSHA